MTHVFAILDRSGSMGGLETDTIGGYNGFIDKLRGEKGVRLTLTLFDNEFEQPYSDLPIKEVPKLDAKTYYVRGATALIDAFCRTINEGKSKVKKNDKAIVLVITDGYENSSRENTSEDMKKLVADLDKQKNWTFTYLGANQDAWGVAQRWGFSQGNVSNYHATAAGTQASWGAMGMSVGAAVRSASPSNNMMFSDEVKHKLEETK